MRMILREHRTDTSFSTALYSDCERYRYALSRVWDQAGDRVLFVMLNPSKATEIDNDPTVERCERRARALGYGSFCVTNIFAWRETDPKALRVATNPVGPDNDDVLCQQAAKADCIIAAWGVHGDHLGRGSKVEHALRGAGHDLYHLGLTKAGLPRHPLYVAYATQPEIWQAASEQ